MRAIAAVALLALLACQAYAAEEETCPLKPEDYSAVDWTTIKKPCGDTKSADFCKACLCSVGSAIRGGLDKKKVMINGKPASQAADVNGLVNICQGDVFTLLTDPKKGNLSPAAQDKMITDCAAMVAEASTLCGPATALTTPATTKATPAADAATPAPAAAATPAAVTASPSPAPEPTPSPAPAAKSGAATAAISAGAIVLAAGAML